jgi:hypothetical protein
MKVGVAHAAGRDLDEDFASPGLGDWDLFDMQPARGALEDCRSHEFHQMLIIDLSRRSRFRVLTSQFVFTFGAEFPFRVRRSTRLGASNPAPERRTGNRT